MKVAGGQSRTKKICTYFLSNLILLFDRARASKYTQNNQDSDDQSSSVSSDQMGDSSVAGSYSKKEQSYIRNEITDRYGTFNYDKD